MKLECVDVKNFRCFAELSLQLHPELTVLIAPNGAGKTTLLDAIRIAVWPYVKGFDLGSQTGKSATIQQADVRRIRQPNGNMEPVIPAQVAAIGRWPGRTEPKQWLQWREKMTSRSNTLGDDDARRLTATSKACEQRIFSDTPDPDLILPLIAYLGTGRLWYQGRYSSKVTDAPLDENSYSRTSGYQDCLTATSSYKQFEQWYGWVFKSYRERQMIALERNTPLDEQGQRFKTAIDVVQQAVNQLIQPATGWADIAYSASQQQQIVLSHPEQGEMPLDMLSDGLRNVVVMVAGLAFRCIKLNPQAGNAAAQITPGVVMIDEVDMFLHPQWQQQILQALRGAFPALQFIVTTHSPQVLTTVPSECIRILSAHEVVTPTVATLGEESRTTLEDVMHVNSRPRDTMADALQDYR